MPNEKARALRKRLTPQETKLWVKLREPKQLGFHFRRRAPISRFIVDFVSFSHRLVIGYLAEFDFRYNNRMSLGINDGERRANALKGIEGKRLTYRPTN